MTNREIVIRNIGFILNRMRSVFQIKNSSVKKNFLSLSILQITNYVFPLLTIPYISRIFGPETYGLLNFATSFLSYFWLLVNYGFDLSASRDIAQNRNNHEKMQTIFNLVLFSRLFMYVIATFIFLLVLIYIDKLNQYSALYLIMFFGGVFNIFFPTWFFQGIEKLNLTAVFTFIIRLIFTLTIFLLIKNKNDYILYPVATIIGQIVVAAVAMYITIYRYNVRLCIPQFNEVIGALFKNWRYFITIVSLNFYTSTSFVILGFLRDNHEVGIYSSAYKVISIFNMIVLWPFNQSIFPRVAYLIKENPSITFIKELLMKYLKYISILSLGSTVFLLVLSPLIIRFLYGDCFSEAIKDLRILSFVLPINGIAQIFIYQGLINLKKDKFVMKLTLFTGIFSIIASFILVDKLGSTGTSIVWLLSESIMAIASYLYLRNFLNKKRLFSYEQS